MPPRPSSLRSSYRPTRRMAPGETVIAAPTRLRGAGQRRVRRCATTCGGSSHQASRVSVSKVTTLSTRGVLRPAVPLIGGKEMRTHAWRLTLVLLAGTAAALVGLALGGDGNFASISTASAAAPADTVIDFEDLAPGDVLTTQYESRYGLTFTGTFPVPRAQPTISAFPDASSGKNI